MKATQQIEQEISVVAEHPDSWTHTQAPLHISKCSGGVKNTEMKPLDIGWDDLVRQMKQADVGPKEGSYITRCAFTDNRRHAETQLPGFLLILDGDSRIVTETGKNMSGAPDPELVHAYLYEQDITHLIFSSHSNQQDGKGHRYRVLIPAYLNDQQDLDIAIAWLLEKLNSAGVPLADVKENHTFAQPWYLPRVPDETAREKFVFHEHDGLQNFPWPEARQWWAQNKPEVPETKFIEESIPIRSTGKHETDLPIFKFNETAGHSGMLKMLLQAGYVFAQQTVINSHPAWRFMHPQSSSKCPGVLLFMTNDGDWRVYSHHGKYDPLSGRAEDAFGLFTTLRHKGNFEVALQAAISLLEQHERAKRLSMTLVEALCEYEVEDDDVKNIGHAEHLYKTIIPKGQLVAVVAPPNAGKTSVFEFLAARFPGQVLYINVDISAVHIPAAFARAKVGGYRLICPDLKQGGSAKKIIDILETASEGGEDLGDVVIIIDTLKKIMDMMSKRSVPKVMDLLRRLTAKGASVILLGHTNKYPDQEGWPAYEGVGDLRSDVDAMAVMIPFRKSKDIVLTSLYWQQDGWVFGKDRGPVEPGSWLIDRGDDRRVDELDTWIDTRALASSQSKLLEESDIAAEIHDYLLRHPEGVLKTELVNVMAREPFAHPRRRVAELLRKHTGHFWNEIQQKVNNAKLFKANPLAVLPGTVEGPE
jgi:hypothetical protein